VVLTERIELDVAHHDHVVVIVLEHTRTDGVLEVRLIAAGEPFHAAGHAIGCAHEAIAVRVLTQEFQLTPDQLLELRPTAGVGNLLLFPFRWS
jgi:hypothetical protein